MPIRWDAHCCPQLTLNSCLKFLNRYKKIGVDFISLNVGFDLNTQQEIVNLLNYIRDWINNNEKYYRIIQNVQQIQENKKNNLLSIAFDIEGCNVLNTNVEMVELLYELGVRQMTFSYNNNNLTGGGCFYPNEKLTLFGKRLVKKFNEIGMIIDCSHVGYRTSLDIIELSEHPVIFSHSNPYNLVNHPRNITNEQIIECAKIGGVVGINGVGIFLGNNETHSLKIVEHIEYIIKLVGVSHVGIGLDCLFNSKEMTMIAQNNPFYFPKGYGFDEVNLAQPEQFNEIQQILKTRGYNSEEINMILGDNFVRVAKQIWK